MANLSLRLAAPDWPIYLLQYFHWYKHPASEQLTPLPPRGQTAGPPCWGPAGHLSQDGYRSLAAAGLPVASCPLWRLTHAGSRVGLSTQAGSPQGPEKQR